MQETPTYRYEFRGTMEIPFQVLATRGGSLQEARELCHAYACQIVLHDDSGVRGWVKPDGRYELRSADTTARAPADADRVARDPAPDPAPAGH